MQTENTFRLFLALAIGSFLLGLLSGCGNFASRGLNADGTRKFEQARYTEAIQRFHKAIESDPKNPDSYYNLARTHHQLATTYHRKNDWDQAESYYNRCLDYCEKNDKEHVACYRGLAVMLQQQGRTDAAFRLMQGWADRNPISPEPRIELARLSEEAGQADVARTRLQEALALEPSNSRALAALGSLHEKEGHTEEALANYQRSLYANRYQPQVAARIAALGSFAPGGATGVSPMVNSSSESRMASRGSSTLR